MNNRTILYQNPQISDRRPSTIARNMLGRRVDNYHHCGDDLVHFLALCGWQKMKNYLLCTNVSVSVNVIDKSVLRIIIYLLAVMSIYMDLVDCCGNQP